MQQNVTEAKRLSELFFFCICVLFDLRANFSLSLALNVWHTAITRQLMNDKRTQLCIAGLVSEISREKKTENAMRNVSSKKWFSLNAKLSLKFIFKQIHILIKSTDWNQFNQKFIMSSFQNVEEISHRMFNNFQMECQSSWKWGTSFNGFFS